MAKTADIYESFVEHPRYGRGPIITGLNPDKARESRFSNRIPNTAIAADLSRQTPATVPIAHYYDLKRQCRGCERSFIFFAREQKYWYEHLGFSLDSDCVRCLECRKRQQGHERNQIRYEELSHVSARSTSENLEMAECCLSLVQEGIFHRRQLEHVRHLLKRASQELNDDARYKKRYKKLVADLTAFEASGES
jgi:hypothetical protein